MTKAALLSSQHSSRFVEGKSISARERAPSYFQSVITTDEDTLESVQDLNENFGSIEVRVHRGKQDDQLDSAPLEKNVDALASTFNELAIKEKKVSHVCSFSAPVQVTTTFRKFTYLDPISKPFHTFNFKYRSKTLLQAIGIVKTFTGSPAPLRSRVNQLRDEGDISVIVISSDEDTADDEDLEDRKRIRELEAALAKAKRAAEVKKSVKKVVKTEIEDVKPSIKHVERTQARARPAGKVKKEVV